MRRTSSVRAFIALSIFLSTVCPAIADPPADLEVQFLDNVPNPVAIRHAGDGSGRLFIAERAGRIWIWDGSSVLPTPFLDIDALVDSGGGEQGLLGLDFHPNYQSNGFFYVSYTRDPGPGLDDRSVIQRFTVSADPNVADDTTGFTILEVAQDFSNHNGGDIHFGPDGYLYFGLGDGGSGGDPLDRSQTLSQLLGKMLRIDVDGTPPPGPNDLCGLVTNYGIPADNPFVGGSGDCDEIWSVGWRNPWRWSFDRWTGDMFIGDVGQDSREEVSFEPAGSGGGDNYGWSCREGFLDVNFNDCLAGPLTDPIHDYSHDFGPICGGASSQFICSVIGGYRYRGSLGGMRGDYFFTDACSGQICIAQPDGGGGWTTTFWEDPGFGANCFGEDEQGELYLCGGGAIYRIRSPTQLFSDGFESGDVMAWGSSNP